MNNSERALVVLAREPEEGEVKSRLNQDLSARDTLDLYQAFVLDTLHLAFSAEVGHLYVACLANGPKVHLSELLTHFAAELKGKKREFLKEKLVLIDQRGRLLGERLEKTFRQVFQEGYKEVVIIGIDSPSLPKKTLDRAFKVLHKKDVVLGPTLDGGYYLLGLVKLHPQLFEGIPWGTGAVYRETVERIKKLGLEWEELELWYDVDTTDDLEFLVRDINQLRLAGDEKSLKHTEEVLARILKAE